MWLKTTNEVYGAIFSAHQWQLKVYSTFTDNTGGITGSKPRMITEWGLKDANYPLLQIHQTKENEEQKEWDVEYFIHYL